MEPTASEELFNAAVKEMRRQARFKKAWKIISADYPDLIVELPHSSEARRRFRFRCDDWDDQAPSVKSVDEDRNELEGEPTGGNWMGLNTGWGLCAVGTREYHAHHTENPWANNRENYSLSRIVTIVAQYYRQASV